MARCAHARSLATADTVALEKADPTGWAGRLKKILSCPALVSLTVLIAMVLTFLATVAWKRIETIADRTSQVEKRQDLIEQRLGSIDENVKRIEENVRRIFDTLIRRP